MTKILLPKETRDLLDHYLNLNIAGKKICCPYFQNFTHKSGKPVDVGKGLPSEIEHRTNDLFKRLGKDLGNLETEQIRQCMIMVGLGIDCSGFVLRVLNSYLSSRNLKSLSSTLKPRSNSILDFARHRLKFMTNVSANLLTSDKNSMKVKIHDVVPSDLIRFGKGHVAIVAEVHKQSDAVKKIVYFHSTYDYFEEAGVKSGEIMIIDEKKPLSQQKWLEEIRGVNWTLKDYLSNNPNDRGLRRLKGLL